MTEIPFGIKTGNSRSNKMAAPWKIPVIRFQSANRSAQKQSLRIVLISLIESSIVQKLCWRREFWRPAKLHSLDVQTLLLPKREIKFRLLKKLWHQRINLLACSTVWQFAGASVQPASSTPRENRPWRAMHGRCQKEQTLWTVQFLLEKKTSLRK